MGASPLIRRKRQLPRLDIYIFNVVRHSVSPAATEKPVGGPRPSASIGAAGATVTPRSPLPGNASSREVLGRLARHRR